MAPLALGVQYFAYLPGTGQLSSFEVVFPDDERREHRVWFRDHSARRVFHYLVFVRGVNYGLPGRKISFSHEPCSDGESGGVRFSSDQPLR